MQQFPNPIYVEGNSGVPESTYALVSLILGIVGFFVCGLLAIPGIILANSAIEITKKYPTHPDASTAKAAQVINIVVIVINLLVVLGVVIIIGAIGIFGVTQ